MRKLSELEGVCLGIIRKFQPCTAYGVRLVLKASPSSHWQASAGSVYPLLARLETEKLIFTEDDETDGRGRKLLTVTGRGRQSLRSWITMGSEPVSVAAVMDPTRTRLFFLDVLNEQQRRDYVNKLIVAMESHLEDTRVRLGKSPEEDDLFDHLGALGATLATQARLEWLKIVRQKLKV